MTLDQDIIIKLLLATLIGGSIGWEREMRSKSAGFRTLILICIGATMFTIFSELIGSKGAPERIASNIVVGIGFLGAGVIFKSNNRVNGITTAASIWVTAALGMGIGSGHYLVSALGCVLVLLILVVFALFDKHIDSANQVRDYGITFPFEKDAEHKYEKLFRHHHLNVLNRAQCKTGQILKGKWTVQGAEKDHFKFIALILEDESVSEFEF
jgi:putative Mg2+ transporter-C (MgtC) family protein